MSTSCLQPFESVALTGLRPETLGIWDLPTHFRQKVPEVVTLPQHFKQQGYFTQNIGKIFHNWRQDDFRGDSESWSVPATMHYASHGSDKAQSTDGSEQTTPENLSTVPRTEMCDVEDDAYFDGRIADMAVKALGERAQAEQPFFLAVGFWKPHAPFNAPKKYWDMYERDLLPAIENPEPPKNAPEIALHDSREILRGFRTRPNGRPTPSDAKALRHGYYAATTFVDAQIGKVLEQLEALGLHNRTIVVLWSDHGFHLGEHSLWAKTSNFEWDARVPMIIASPQYTGAQRSSSMVELLDLYPTLVDLCELPQPEHLEGQSLRPILEEPTQSVKRAARTWHPRPAYPAAGKAPEAMGFSLRTSRYRYTEWRDFKSRAVLGRELYDHQTDPLETHNVAGIENNSEIIARLSRLLNNN